MRSILRIVTLLFVATTSLETSSKAQERTEGYEFAPCADAASHASLMATECALIEVPLDYSRPEGDKIEIFVRKFHADGVSRGQLWFVAGGPGESGASFYPHIDKLKAAAPGLDLLISDHRGTGFSTRLCPLEEAQTSKAGSALAEEEWGTCFGALNEQVDRTRSFTISNAARDLQLLMSRLDAGGSTYVYGVSYGTQLVLRMLTLGVQAEIDGIIFDSLVPLEGDHKLDLSHRSAVTDLTGRELLRECDIRIECSRYFPDGSEKALHQLLMRQDLGNVVDGNVKHQLAALLDFPETQAMIPNVIAGLQMNDPTWHHFAMERLLSLGSDLTPFPQSVASIPLVSLISRSENNARPDLTSDVIDREADGYLFTSPLPSLLLVGGIPTYERDESFGALPSSIPPTIVLHGSLDPKTPYHGAERHVAKLKTRGDIALVRIERAPHFILMTAPEEVAIALQRFLLPK